MKQKKWWTWVLMKMMRNSNFKNKIGVAYAVVVPGTTATVAAMDVRSEPFVNWIPNRWRLCLWVSEWVSLIICVIFCATITRRRRQRQRRRRFSYFFFFIFYKITLCIERNPIRLHLFFSPTMKARWCDRDIIAPFPPHRCRYKAWKWWWVVRRVYLSRTWLSHTHTRRSTFCRCVTTENLFYVASITPKHTTIMIIVDAYSAPIYHQMTLIGRDRWWRKTKTLVISAAWHRARNRRNR